MINEKQIFDKCTTKERESDMARRGRWCDFLGAVRDRGVHTYLPRRGCRKHEQPGVSALTSATLLLSPRAPAVCCVFALLRLAALHPRSTSRYWNQSLVQAAPYVPRPRSYRNANLSSRRQPIIIYLDYICREKLYWQNQNYEWTLRYAPVY